MELVKDLFTVYGDLLVPERTEITPSVIKKINLMCLRHKKVLVPIVNTDIFNDFKDVFGDVRYSIMFKPPASKDDILEVAGKMLIENDLICELNNMKGNLPYTYRHVLIVAALSIKVGMMDGKGNYDTGIVSHCGFTHDMGKTRIPISILNKSKKLTRHERIFIETHPAIGYLLLQYYLKKNKDICSMASLGHHERLDGSGYPKGIVKVDKYSQLISAVDVLDALMTKRPYRDRAFSLRASLDYLLQEAAMKKFNKHVVLTLISMARKTKPEITSMHISAAPREELPEKITHDKYR